MKFHYISKATANVIHPNNLHTPRTSFEKEYVLTTIEVPDNCVGIILPKDNAVGFLKLLQHMNEHIKAMGTYDYKSIIDQIEVQMESM